MRNVLKLITCIALFPFALNAQHATDGQLMQQKITGSEFSIYYHQYKGYPYYENSWSNASLKLTNGEVYNGLLVKIDLYKEQLISYNKKLNRQIVVDNIIIDEIYLYNSNKQKLHTIKNAYGINDTIAGRSNFYFVLLNDTISVWCHNKKHIEKYANVSSNLNILGEFYSKNNYYYLLGGELISIPSNKRLLAKKFPNNRKAIISYMNKNRLRLKHSGDIVTVFKYINQIERKTQ